MADNITSTGASSGATGMTPGNVYHKEKRPPRVQRTNKPRLESGIFTPAPRKQERDNPYRQALLISLRRFVIAAGIMVVFLLVVIKGLETMDQRYDRKFVPKLDEKVASEKDVLPAHAPSQAETAVAKSEQKTVKHAAEPDNDAMRKAAFLARRGKDLEAAGSFDEAIARYHESLDTWPYQPQVWAQLGRLHLRTGDYLKAQSALERAALDNPTAPQVLNDLGVAYLQRGNVDEAIKRFGAYVEYDPSFAPSYFNLSLCYLAKRNLSKAREAIARYLELKPEDPRALRQAAFIDASTNDLTTAMGEIEKAIALSPDWALLYLDAAATSALMGRTNETLTYLAQAESKTAPGIIHRFFQEPAFDGIRASGAGMDFEKAILARARTASSSTDTVDTAQAQSEPISSVSATP
ncbi:MAG: tetratricopeptide repeat protein [bacterium]